MQHYMQLDKARQITKLGDILPYLNQDVSYLDPTLELTQRTWHKEILILNNPIDFNDLSQEFLDYLDSFELSSSNLLFRPDYGTQPPIESAESEQVNVILTDCNTNILSGIEYLYKAYQTNSDGYLMTFSLDIPVVKGCPYDRQHASYEELRDDPSLIYKIIGIDSELRDISYKLGKLGLVTKFSCIGHEGTQLSPHAQLIFSPKIHIELLRDFENYLSNSFVSSNIEINYVNLIEREEHSASLPNLEVVSKRGMSYDERLELINNLSYLIDLYIPPMLVDELDYPSLMLKYCLLDATVQDDDLHAPECLYLFQEIVQNNDLLTFNWVLNTYNVNTFSTTASLSGALICRYSDNYYEEGDRYYVDNVHDGDTIIDFHELINYDYNSIQYPFNILSGDMTCKLTLASHANNLGLDIKLKSGKLYVLSVITNSSELQAYVEENNIAKSA